MSNVTEKNITTSDWCIDISNLTEEVALDTDSLDVDVVIESIIVPIVGTFGIAGNIVSILVLSKKEFQETFHRLLICLALVDIVFIVCAIITCVIRTHSLLEGEHWRIWEPIFLFSIPMGGCALVTSMYLTVSISVERYFGICFPLHSRVRGGRRLVLYLLPVLLFSLAFNLPKFLEISPDLGIDWEFSHNVLYNKIYKQYIELLVTVALPWLILVYLNFRIYLAVTDKSLSGWSETQRQRREKSLAVILISIVLVFLSCHSLKLYLAFYKIHILNKTVHCNSLGLSPSHPSWLLTTNTVNHLMLVSNSSANFIIYCFMGKRFRKSLLSTLSDSCRSRSHGHEHKSLERKSLSNSNKKTETSFMSHSSSYRPRKL